MGINGEELILLLIIAVIVIGPERLPAYAEQLGNLARNLKKMATGATERVKEELGEEAEDLDLSQFDPRQYDPRRIVREALAEDVLPPSQAMRVTPGRPMSSVRSSTATGRSTPDEVVQRRREAARKRAEEAKKRTDAAKETADDGAATATSAGTTAVGEGATQVSAPAGAATVPADGAGANGAADPAGAAGAAGPADHTGGDLVPAGAPFDDEAT